MLIMALISTWLNSKQVIGGLIKPSAWIMLIRAFVWSCFESYSEVEMSPVLCLFSLEEKYL